MIIIFQFILLFLNYFSQDLNISRPTEHILWLKKHVLLDLDLGLLRIHEAENVGPKVFKALPRVYMWLDLVLHFSSPSYYK